MLRRETYIGRVIWNRSKFVKSPGSNKRVRRLRPRSEWRVIEQPQRRIVSDELWARVMARLVWTKATYGKQKRDGLLNRTASSKYLLSGIVKCAVCGGNLVITSGRSLRGHRRYGCSQHHYRGACSNGLQIRKDWLEEKLLAGLQDAVLKPEAIEYAVQEFSRQLKEATGTLSHEADRATLRKSQLETELNRLVDAIAGGGHSVFLMEAIQEKEQEIRVLDERVNAACESLPSVQPADIVSFVTGKLSRLSSLLNGGVPQARAELLRHVTEIRLIPQETNNGSDYVAVGNWNLLGNSLETDRARHLLGVRARLVAGACNHPNCLALPFSLELIRLAA
jgi:site-specific DNA recombinase